MAFGAGIARLPTAERIDAIFELMMGSYDQQTCDIFQAAIQAALDAEREEE